MPIQILIRMQILIRIQIKSARSVFVENKQKMCDLRLDFCKATILTGTLFCVNIVLKASDNDARQE